MKRSTLLVAVVIATCGLFSRAADQPDEDLSKYVCTTHRLSVPESFNPKNVAQCKLLAKTNPQRFEAHATLAVALTGAGQFEEALDEFRRTDELSSTEADPAILASLPYEDIYVSTLLAAAAKRCANDGGDLSALRMLQQALGMGESHLRKDKQLSKCYTMLAHLYLKRGLYAKMLEACTKGIKAAKAEGQEELVPVLEQGLLQARGLQSKQPGQTNAATNAAALVAPEGLWRRAELGEVKAQADMALMYLKGDGGKQDYVEAAKWLRKAAEQGEVRSQYNLGYLYEKGQGVTQDGKEAVKWYRKAADQNYPEAALNLGILYAHGTGLTPDYAEALKWLRKAADWGLVMAYEQIGVMYLQGHGVPVSTNEAVKWFRQAAEKGSAWAQTSLGVSYLDGSGVERNEAEAFRWLQKGAEQGFAQAQFGLGNCYLEGCGVATNAQAAVKWYRLAAEQGHPAAQLQLSACLALGKGAPADPVEAYKWVSLAARQGVPRASAARDALAERLSTDALFEGMRRAAAFTPRPKVFPEDPE